MATSRRTTIGLFLNSFYGEYMAQVWAGAVKAAGELGITLLAFTDNSLDDRDPAVRRRKDLFGLADPSFLDGIILLPSAVADSPSQARLALFLDAFSSLPAVHVGVEDETKVRVVAENRAGLGKLIDHLIECHGRSRIAFIRGPVGVSDADERFEAYRASLEAHGIPFRPELVKQGDFRRESGKTAALSLLGSRERFDALVGANDFMAIYAMKELQRSGIRVPEEVSVGGFDDSAAGRGCVPSLCTVRQPTEDIGAEAIRLLTAAMRGGGGSAGRRALPTRMIPRRSCGCLSVDGTEEGTMDSREPAIGEDGYKKLAAAYAAAPDRRFLALLEDEVAAAYKRGVRISAWQDIVPGLVGGLEGRRNGEGWEAERSIMKFLSALQDEISSSALLANMEAGSAFDELSDRILGSFDSSTVKEFLRGEFPAWGAFFCLSLFTSPREAEVFFCSDDSLEGKAFSLPSLVPDEAVERLYGCDLIAHPLADRDETLGFFVSSARGRQPSYFEVLSEHLGGALLGIRMVTSIREHSETLERYVAERTSELARALEELKASKEKFERLSSVDELTGLYNRRGFFELAGRQIELSRRRGADFLLLYVDLDSLKKINDEYGHAAGDDAIKAIASVLSKAFRQTDIIARLGGDEFTVLAIDCTKRECGQILERTRAILKEHNDLSGKPYRLSFSVGISGLTEKPDAGLDALLADADARLYEAKKLAKERSNWRL